MKNQHNLQMINELKLRLKNYTDITKVISATKNRISAIYPDLSGKEMEEQYKRDSFLNGQDAGRGESKIQGLEQIKGRVSRDILKILPHWPIWTFWLEGIKGIGPYIAAELIVLYYYRSVPVCTKCGTAVIKKEIEKEGSDKKVNVLFCTKCNKKSEGRITFRNEIKDFPNISKWWKYMGRHTEEGKMPKRRKGVQSDWSQRGRALGFAIKDQFNRQDKENFLYKKHFLERLKKKDKARPELSPGHRYNMSWNETVKLFLSHFWQVARTIDNLPVTEPYSKVIMGHTGIIDPFYWEGLEIKKAA